jgi:hypothetical protein
LFDDPIPRRHNLTRYICAKHYAQLMGPAGAKQVGLPIQALSSKNELPSEVADILEQLERDAYILAEAQGGRSDETSCYAAAQAILSLQRRLDERDALLLEARPYVEDCFSELDQRLLAKIDAALNPKDTGQ